MEKQNVKKSKALAQITEIKDLIEYLSDVPARLENTSDGSKRYVYHYTSFEKAKKIINGGFWRLGSPQKMNDGLEFSILNDKSEKQLYYACFMYDSAESIAMWSMYGQPWENGVMLRIPVEHFKKWVRSNKEVYADNGEGGLSLLTANPASIIRVAYTNADSIGEGDVEKLICGSATNLNFKNASHMPELAGYIKDMAWSYEREVRVLVSTESEKRYNAVYVKLPENILDSIEIFSGPRFTRNLETLIEEDLDYDVSCRKSLFTGKLQHIACDDCGYKNKK